MTAAAPANPARPPADVQGDSFLRGAITIVLIVFVTGLISKDLIGDPMPLFLLVWLPLLLKYTLASPPHLAFRVMFTLCLVLEGPDERPGNGYWDPPFMHPNLTFYGGLNSWSGIPGLSAPLFAFICIALWLKARKASRELGYPQPPPEAVLVLKLWFGIMVAWMVWGIARGGVVAPMFWQVVQMFCMALCTLALLYCTRGPQDTRAFGTIVVVAAVAKGLLVAWVYIVVLGPLGKKPFYATTHSDSITFATAFIILALRLYEERTKQALKWMAILAPFLLIVIVMNNRRLAFVCIGTGLLTAFLVMRKDMLKRKLIKIAIAMLPVFAVYVAVGANSDHPVFALAKTVSSVSSSSDSSSLTREIENYNLIVTLQESKLLGSGYGHEYVEFIKADDISGGHPLYLYIPHNSVLWLVSVGGMLGFPLMWMLYPGLAYFAARTYHRALTPRMRAAGLVGLGITFVLMVQAWGDMGLNSYTCGGMFAGAYALCAKLCLAAEKASAAPAPRAEPPIATDKLLPAATSPPDANQPPHQGWQRPG